VGRGGPPARIALIVNDTDDVLMRWRYRFATDQWTTLQAGLTVEQVAEKAGVNAKTVERWMTTDRAPYARHRHTVSTLVGQAESYLWPAAVPPERQAKIAASEIAGVYPHRTTIPSNLWDHLLHSANDRLDILVHAGLFLVERPDFIQPIAQKAGAGVAVRIAFG
jgi:hypothetical protein